MTKKWGGFQRIQRPWDLIFLNDNFTPHIYSSATQQIRVKYILCTNNQKMQHPIVLGFSWPLSLLLGLCPWRAEAHGGSSCYYSSHCCDKTDAQEEQVQPGKAHSVPAWGLITGEGLSALVVAEDSEVVSHICLLSGSRRKPILVFTFFYFPLFYSAQDPSSWIVLPHLGWVFPLQLDLSGSLLMVIFRSYFLGNTKSCPTDNED